MKSFLTLPVIFTVSLALSDRPAFKNKNALSLHPRDTNTSCATLHMIVARGSLESQGEGATAAVANDVQSQIPGSDSEAVVYPATLENYVYSESDGVAAMTSLITSYEARCPNSKIALLGYSQGAQVVGDVLCGTSETYWNSTAPVMSKNIIASIQFGDPSFVLNQPQDVGNATKGGIFPRNNTAACPTSIMKSYCNFNDTFCDSGSSLKVHESYIYVYGDAATQWIVGNFGAVNGTNSTSGGGSASGANSTLTSNASGLERLGGWYLTGTLGLMFFAACLV